MKKRVRLIAIPVISLFLLASCVGWLCELEGNPVSFMTGFSITLCVIVSTAGLIGIMLGVIIVYEDWDSE